ncbi:LPXTG cell wall anchor domain-containing protein [Lactococcus petauri]|nr:LPXTG cell wall anchor domain-containing protein [Lactococcus petauri]
MLCSDSTLPETGSEDRLKISIMGFVEFALLAGITFYWETKRQTCT